MRLIIVSNRLPVTVKGEKGEYTFAQTFPTGTHAMWTYYWLAAYGIHPFQDVKTITVPPPQMVANMRVGNMDGYCVGEPWPYRAIVDKIGFTAETTQGLWKDHPEKALGTTAEFVQKYPKTARAMTAAVTVSPATNTMMPITRIMPSPLSWASRRRIHESMGHPLFRSRTDTAACLRLVPRPTSASPTRRRRRSTPSRRSCANRKDSSRRRAGCTRRLSSTRKGTSSP